VLDSLVEDRDDVDYAALAERLEEAYQPTRHVADTMDGERAMVFDVLQKMYDYDEDSGEYYIDTFQATRDLSMFGALTGGDAAADQLFKADQSNFQVIGMWVNSRARNDYGLTEGVDYSLFQFPALGMGHDDTSSVDSKELNVTTNGANPEAAAAFLDRASHAVDLSRERCRVAPSLWASSPPPLPWTPEQARECARSVPWRRRSEERSPPSSRPRPCGSAGSAIGRSARSRGISI